MKKMLVLVLSFSSLNLFGQKIYSTEKDVFDIKEIIFYGYDFSHFKLADAKLLSNGNIKKYIPAWIGFLNEHTNETDLQRRFKKEKVAFNFEYTTSLIKKLNEDDLVTAVKHILSPDSIQSYISNYQIKENEGIGFVIIIECFEKEKKRVNAYFTFFDISTKKIIMSDYFGANEADGYGLSNYWGVGLNATFAQYIGEIYKKKLKVSLK